MVSRAVREAIEGRLLTNSTPIRAFQEKWDEADWQGAATSPARHAESDAPKVASGRPVSRQRLSAWKSRNVKSGALVLWREGTRRPDHSSTARARWNDMTWASCQRGFAWARQAT
jgi:hypothetical protein